ncbi:hypothetical protein AB4Z10_09625 [Bosea sp. RAF48]|uniref:hypothetical protein n=1 Tax=Bosea sp. RAF48 TaxID=3237480 RepID=UPI003F93460E
MLATQLTKHEERSIRRTHSALIPAYILRDDGSVMKFWPSGHVEQIVPPRGDDACQGVKRSEKATS